ncbi:hypothetical protein SLEP1_g56689 [Rubroshorea leprosula]|uniref:Reverse transcriptase Ty1/copia-type domain-containing protein n=1 Tax=Rubroshorea leprosula TaxID=152421 RepID=A0AAV5MKC6_9ROSI|nr:hypothetical protein SLEP1_g56689 [Rubroshorea leprosula]
MVSFERTMTYPAAAMVAKEAIDQPIVNLESLKQVILNLFNASTALSATPRPTNRTTSSNWSQERFWSEAALATVYLINRIPLSVVNNKSPYECLHGIPPTYHLLKDLVSQKLRVSRHVVFWEHTMFSSLSNFQVSSFEQPPLFTNPSIELFPSDSDADTFDELHEAFPHAPPSSREDVLPVGNALDNVESSSLPSSVSPIGSNPVDIEPKNEILDPPSSHPTQQAMLDELQALDKTCTWHLVDLLAGKPLVGCKWVYKIKTRFDGSVEHYKACLIAKGFTQEYGIDYEETFALVTRPTLVCSLIAIAIAKRWKLFQMDVKNAFLNGDLAKEVYMKPPPRLEHPPNKVCRLKQALYGLKQAPRAWFAKFSTTINEFGFTSSPHDTTLFIRKTNHGMVLLLLYVDDMIITRDDISSIHDLKQFLNHKFEKKDLGVLSYFLGLVVTSSDDGYFLS